MAESLILVLLAAFAWFAIDSMRARERAHAAGRNACQRNNLQFLDDTVELVSLRPARDEDGRLRLRRVYAFEFSDPQSDGGNNRRSGRVTMFQAQIESLTLDPFVDGMVDRIVMADPSLRDRSLDS
jgi:hypothetical protein